MALIALLPCQVPVNARAPSGALWDDIPGAVIGYTLVIGTGRHVSVSLVDHEVGHALEGFDDMASGMEWQTIMRRCRPLLAVDRYADTREWWAEAYAYCASGQLGQLTRMLSGNASVMEMLCAYYRRHYGLEVRR